MVDAATIVNDALADKAQVNLTELNNMYVTSKDVDYQIKQISHILCDAINEALEL